MESLKNCQVKQCTAVAPQHNRERDFPCWERLDCLNELVLFVDAHANYYLDKFLNIPFGSVAGKYIIHR